MRIHSDLGIVEHELTRARQSYLDVDQQLQRTLQAPGDRELLRTLEELRVALASVAEPQQQLQRTSELASRVLPHDEAVLILFPEGGEARVFSTGKRVPFPKALLRALAQRSAVTRQAQLIADPMRLDLPGEISVRSGLRAPLEVAGRLRAELLLSSRSSQLYVERDLLFAQL